MTRKEIELIIEDTLENRKVPVLVLDSRWHDLFPPGRKPSNIASLEDKLNELMREQGKLVNDIKNLKRAKKKCMGEIVSQMDSMSEKKKKQNQRLILEMNERLEKDTKRVMDLPYEIKKINQQLLVEGVLLCSQQVDEEKKELETLKQEITKLKEQLGQKQDELDQRKKTSDSTYTYLHNLIGPTANILLDGR